MIGEECFKGFCRQAEDGEEVRYLFITPSGPVRDMQKMDMFAMANSHGLNAFWLGSSNRIVISNAFAYLRTAHGYLDRELEGVEFDVINGLEFYDKPEDAELISNLKSQVR